MKSKGTGHPCSDVVWSLNTHWHDEGREGNFLQVTQKKPQQRGIKEVVWTNLKGLPKVSHSDVKVSFGLHSHISRSQRKPHPEIGHTSAFNVHHLCRTQDSECPPSWEHFAWALKVLKNLEVSKIRLLIQPWIHNPDFRLYSKNRKLQNSSGMTTS